MDILAILEIILSVGFVLVAIALVGLVSYLLLASMGVELVGLWHKRINEFLQARAARPVKIRSLRQLEYYESESNPQEDDDKSVDLTGVNKHQAKPFLRVAKPYVGLTVKNKDVQKILALSNYDYTDFRRETVYEFLREWCDLDYGMYMPSAELFSYYELWCDEKKIPLRANKISFSKHAVKYPHGVIKPHRMRINGDRKRVLFGVSLNVYATLKLKHEHGIGAVTWDR